MLTLPGSTCKAFPRELSIPFQHYPRCGWRPVSELATCIHQNKQVFFCLMNLIPSPNPIKGDTNKNHLQRLVPKKMPGRRLSCFLTACPPADSTDWRMPTAFTRVDQSRYGKPCTCSRKEFLDSTSLERSEILSPSPDPKEELQVGVRHMQGTCHSFSVCHKHLSEFNASKKGLEEHQENLSLLT